MTPAGLPLGVLRAHFAAPAGKSKAAEAKKSFQWIEGFRDCADPAQEVGRGKLVCVMDREADMFSLFEEQLARPEAELLVRAKGQRKVKEAGSLLDALRAAPVRARTTVAIERLTARPKSSKRKAREDRAKRSATLLLRARSVELAPTGREHRSKPPIRLQGVFVEEVRVAAGEKPIQWLLLTTLAADTPEACQRIVEYYARRWRIEDWHRVLKSGCKVEELENRSAERIARAAAINLVVAWRIMLMTLLGRNQPDLPPSVLFSDLELEVLTAFAAQQGFQAPDTLATAVRAVARIGGYLYRPRGPPPGTKVLWRGHATLQGMCIGFNMARQDRS